jgi:hypothetical protein
MKTITLKKVPKLFSICLLLFSSSILFSQVGIGTVTPSETLDVIGNIEYSGALMPNNLPGTANEILLSGGANSPSVWGPEMLNVSQTTSIGKFFVNGIALGTGSTIITVADANTVVSSTCSVTWFQLTPAPGPPLTDFSPLHIISKAEAGQWIFYIENNTGRAITAGFSFMAFY